MTETVAFHDCVCKSHQFDVTDCDGDYRWHECLKCGTHISVSASQTREQLVMAWNRYVDHGVEP